MTYDEARSDRPFVGGVIALVIVTAIGKHALDVFPIAVAAWAALGLVATRYVRSGLSFVLWNTALLVADALLDIVGMGTHLPASASEVVTRWNFDSGSLLLVAYWVLLWGVLVPQRTIRMAQHTTLSDPIRGALVVTTIGLHVTFVEDVVYFALLGYPPLVTTPPQAYAYLPHLPWMPEWTPPGVWAAAAVGISGFAAVAVVAVRSDHQASRTLPARPR